MKTRFGFAHLVIAAAALLASAMPAVAQPTLTLTGPANFVARWGSDVSIGLDYGGPCTVGMDMTLLTFGAVPSPGYVATSALPMTLGCVGGRFQGSGTIRLDWAGIGNDGQVFHATATSVPPGTTVASNFLSLRFDPEFQLPFYGLMVQATVATAAPRYASCTLHGFDVVDREYLGIPMPPPNLRTPYEMFRVSTSLCTGGNASLLNLVLPSPYDEVWVYDRAGGAPAWRRPARQAGLAPCISGVPGCVVTLQPPPPCPPCEFVGQERDAIIPLFGDGAGVQAVVAVVQYQAEVRGRDLQDLWWAGPSESGWGLHIAKSGDRLFVSGFIYDAAGKPTWVYMPSGQWDPVTQVWYGDLYTPTGSSFADYRVNQLLVGPSIGTGSLSFMHPDAGHFDYTIKGASGGKTISRYVFAPRGDTPSGNTGIWWGGPDQDGWGIAVSQQGDTVFATWFTYNDDRAATWYFMSAGKRTAAGTFKGDLYRATGAAWVGQHYSADSTHVIPVGTLELDFGGVDAPGSMTAVVDGRRVVNPLLHFAF